MNSTDFIGLMNIVSLIVGIVSIVLAIVSLVLSILFYCWGKAESNQASIAVTKIEEKVAFLDKLFDQLYSKAFEAVRQNGIEMQRMLRDSIGTMGTSYQKSYDLELYLILSKPGKHSFSEIAKELAIDKENVKYLVTTALNNPQFMQLGLSVDGEIVEVKNFHIENAQEQSSDE